MCEEAFPIGLRNRLTMPTKHILICEDVLVNQAKIAKLFSDVFVHEGKVQASYVSGASAAKGVIENTRIDLILLDRDMPNGNGDCLLTWMNEKSLTIPIITFSGIDQNNNDLCSLYANQGGAPSYPIYLSNKDLVFNGHTTELIVELLGGTV